MAFHNIRFPVNISYNSSGGPGFMTRVISLDSGSEIRQGRLSLPKYQYNAAYAIRQYEDLEEVKNFFVARNGALHSFRYKDPAAFTTAADHVGATSYLDQVIDASADSGQTVFQLCKRITSGSVTVVLPITKPVDGTVTIGVNGSLESASNYTIDYNTGQLTFTSGLTAGDSVTWGGEYDQHVRFGEETDRLLLSTFDDFSSGSISNIPIVGIMDDVALLDEVPAGGTLEKTITTPYTLDLTVARFFVLVTTDASEDVILPDPDVYNIPTGNNICSIMNMSVSARTLVVKDHDGNTLVTLDPNEGANCHLTVDIGGDKRWYVF